MVGQVPHAVKTGKHRRLEGLDRTHGSVYGKYPKLSVNMNPQNGAAKDVGVCVSQTACYVN